MVTMLMFTANVTMQGNGGQTFRVHAKRDLQRQSSQIIGRSSSASANMLRSCVAHLVTADSELLSDCTKTSSGSSTRKLGEALCTGEEVGGHRIFCARSASDNH